MIINLDKKDWGDLTVSERRSAIDGMDEIFAYGQSYDNVDDAADDMCDTYAKYPDWFPFKVGDPDTFRVEVGKYLKAYFG